jgi:hypothetical protein
MPSEERKPRCLDCLGYQDESSYEDPHGAIYCDECPNVEYFKNWPFENGCKRFRPWRTE